MRPELTVFYNTRCPVCDAGIRAQKNRLLPLVRAGQIAFRDINLEPEAMAVWGASLNDVRKRLHALDAEGKAIVGADVAFALWRITPGQGWIAALLGNPLMRPASRLGYNLFAEVLYRWNKAKGHW